MRNYCETIASLPVTPFSRAPRCGSGPNCLWRAPPPPQTTGGPFLQATALPSPPSLPLPPTPWLFLQCSGRGGLCWRGGEAAHGGWRRRALQAALGARPTSGDIRLLLLPQYPSLDLNRSISVRFLPFRANSVCLGWLLASLGWGVGWGRGGVRKRGFCKGLDGQNRQSPIASDFGSRTQIAALFAVLLYRNVYNESPIARFESQFQIARTPAIRIARVFKSLAVLDLDRAISPIQV